MDAVTISRPHPDAVATAALAAYASLRFTPPTGHYTVVASFLLSVPSPSHPSPIVKTISLATGSKCLPESTLPLHGNALHDFHAEVLARRGAMRWLLEEAGRVGSSGTGESRYMIRSSSDKYALRKDVRLYLYISALPCGDASTCLLAQVQSTDNPAMARLKTLSPPAAPPPGTPARGRDAYDAIGVLRTKPARADAPRSASMSCSDKIARWGVLGVQGALGSSVLERVTLDGIVMGLEGWEDEYKLRADCERAFWGRIDTLKGLPDGYVVSQPLIEFTRVPFVHSRKMLPSAKSSCNDSLCWIADSPAPHEVLIHGVKRGVPPKRVHEPRYRPMLSKLALLNLHRHTLSLLGLPVPPQDEAYRETKRRSAIYQAAKEALQGESGPFSGWICGRPEYESFDSEGILHAS